MRVLAGLVALSLVSPAFAATKACDVKDGCVAFAKALKEEIDKLPDHKLGECQVSLELEDVKDTSFTARITIQKGSGTYGQALSLDETKAFTKEAPSLMRLGQSPTGDQIVHFFSARKSMVWFAAELNITIDAMGSLAGLELNKWSYTGAKPDPTLVSDVGRTQHLVSCGKNLSN